MAQEVQEVKYYDAEKEAVALQRFIKFALEPPTDKWTKHDSKDASVEIGFVYLDNDPIKTIRGRCTIKDGNVDDLYEFFHSKYNDLFEFQMKTDKMCVVNQNLKYIDEEHCAAYSAYEIGFGIWARDFCYIRRRFKFDDYEMPDGTKQKIAGDFCYSLDEKHPCYVKLNKDYVRAVIKMSGFVFVQKNNDMFASYVVNTDPNGWIPNWIVNIVSPDQAMVVKQFEKNFPLLKEQLKIRREKVKQENESKEDAQ